MGDSPTRHTSHTSKSNAAHDSFHAGPRRQASGREGPSFVEENGDGRSSETHANLPAIHGAQQPTTAVAGDFAGAEFSECDGRRLRESGGVLPEELTAVTAANSQAGNSTNCRDVAASSKKLELSEFTKLFETESLTPEEADIEVSKFSADWANYVNELLAALSSSKWDELEAKFVEDRIKLEIRQSLLKPSTSVPLPPYSRMFQGKILRLESEREKLVHKVQNEKGKAVSQLKSTLKQQGEQTCGILPTDNEAAHKIAALADRFVDVEKQVLRSFCLFEDVIRSVFWIKSSLGSFSRDPNAVLETWVKAYGQPTRDEIKAIAFALDMTANHVVLLLRQQPGSWQASTSGAS